LPGLSSEFVIDWSQIKLPSEFQTIQDAVVGEGSSATVFRAMYQPKNGTRRKQNSSDVVIDKEISVAVKVLSKAGDQKDFLKYAREELNILIEAEKRICVKDCIVKAYGIVYGPLSPQFSSLFPFLDSGNKIGIVMGFESGGTLSEFIHSNDQRLISMAEKVKLLCCIAKGLAELHSVGIVHGDLKPDNILLSGDSPPLAKLADFGIAEQRNYCNVLEISVTETTNFRGTPVYCAPEQLMNPFKNVLTDRVVKASRRTDIYSFGVLAWEVLVRQKPFVEVENEASLGMFL
jgi:serine/threonine protein kinase